MSTITRDKIAGALYGVALGDALGRDVEFTKISQIYRRYGRVGHMPLPTPARFTDDTQLTIAVARALGRAESLHPHEVARRLRVEFRRWAAVDEPRAPGVTCLTAIRNMRNRNVSWQDATVASSKGCGANMRVAPAAFIGDLGTMRGIVQLQAAMTHGHPTALAASELTALAMWWAATYGPTHLRELPRSLFEYARQRRESYETEWLGKLDTRRWSKLRLDMRRGWDECVDKLLEVEGALRQDYAGDPCRLLGEAWVAEEAFAVGLYCAVAHRDDPVEAISRGARTNGDSDSIASIAGGVIGAAWGQAAWPSAWTRRIERRHDLEVATDVAFELSK